MEQMVFYAGQSDSPAATNRNAIRRALTDAVAEIEASRPGTVLRVDDATRGMVGAGNVPDSIRLKIEAADIILADVVSSRRHKRGGNPPNKPGLTVQISETTSDPNRTGAYVLQLRYTKPTVQRLPS